MAEAFRSGNRCKGEGKHLGAKLIQRSKAARTVKRKEDNGIRKEKAQIYSDKSPRLGVGCAIFNETGGEESKKEMAWS